MSTWLVLALVPVLLLGLALLVTGALMVKRNRGAGIALMAIGGAVLLALIALFAYVTLALTANSG